MKIVKSQEMPWQQAIDHGRFAGRRKDLGGEKLSCGLWALPPGKRSFPLHRHHVTEEAMFVVSGHATVRTSDGEHAIGPGDFVSFPAGGTAHQLVNDGTEELVYVAFATTPGGADVVEYPDSGKVACRVGAPPAVKRFIFRGKDQADYWEGED
jgi:uncharacterized cupin superfamily protein